MAPSNEAVPNRRRWPAPMRQILIVEDERPIREMIAFGLRRAGFEVVEAEDCKEARTRVADRRPDLVLVDWMLPDLSGLELTRALKKDKDTKEMPPATASRSVSAPCRSAPPNTACCPSS